jgi:hypothetical protein
MARVMACVVTLVLTCTASVTSAEARHHLKSRRCAPGFMPVLHEREEGARLLLANEHAEVYVTYGHGLELHVDGPEIRGCGYGQRRSYNVGAPFGGSGGAGGGTLHLVLRDTIVAGEKFEYCNSCFTGTEAQSVFAIDLRTGAVLGEATSPGGVQSMVVKPDGAIAWIAASNVSITGFHEEWVYALDHDGVRLLAHGSDISDSSLALAGSTIYWTEGGKAFSAALN